MDLIPSMCIAATLLPYQMVPIEHFYGVDNFYNGASTFDIANVYSNGLPGIPFGKGMFHVHFICDSSEILVSVQPILAMVVI